MFSKFKGVPNSHRGILYIYAGFLLVFIVLTLVSGLQKFLNLAPFNFNVNWVDSSYWICTVGALFLFSLSIAFSDFVFWYLGYRSMYQLPLHKVVRAFYKKNNAPYSIDNTGKIYQLSNSELGDRNKAIRHMYLKPYSHGLILIIPCSHWGFLGVSSSVIDNLRDSRGSLDLAQNIVSNAFKTYRFSIRHYHINKNFVYWYLIKKY